MPVYIFFIAAAFIGSLFIYGQTGLASYLKLFPPFLGTSVLVELLALYLAANGKNNYLLYSFFTTIEFSFYLYIISCIVTSIIVRKIIRYILIGQILLSLINIFFVQTNGFNSLTYSLGCLFIVSFCVYYFLELFRRPKSIKLALEPSFWICSGLLFYYCCSFPLFGLITVFFEIPKAMIRSILFIVDVLNALLYTLFIIAFVCKIKTRNPVKSLKQSG